MLDMNDIKSIDWNVYLIHFSSNIYQERFVCRKHLNANYSNIYHTQL